MNTIDLSRVFYCRNCEIATQQRQDLRHSWGYSCCVCSTWQHESLVSEVKQNYAARMILASLADNQLYLADGVLEEFVEAAKLLQMECSYKKRGESYQFKAWYIQDKVARLKLQILYVKF
jgi:hypothetical protein